MLLLDFLLKFSIRNKFLLNGNHFFGNLVNPSFYAIHRPTIDLIITPDHIPAEEAPAEVVSG